MSELNVRAPSPQTALNDPQAIRHAGRELLSLALLDARNQLLLRLGRDESATGLRRAVEAAWYQAHWIINHVQRGRGEDCDPQGVRLAGQDHRLQAWHEADGLAPAPSPDDVRECLSRTLELTLDILASTPEDDRSLHFFRQSLLHEDRLNESWDEALRQGHPAPHLPGQPLNMPASHWLLGQPAGGYVPLLERGALEAAVPEFEIDSHVVNWAQFMEFSEDGGYDSAPWWSPEGWAWVQAVGRRAPAHVEQLRDGVLVNRGGALRYVSAGQPVLHANKHEAEAWCRWAGRRLPTEPEWEMAASIAGSRGFVWGQVFEWVAGSSRAWPGGPVAGQEPPGAIDHLPGTPAAVLRGASFATRARWRHPRSRRFAAAGSDTMFCGFRSCAL